MKKYIVTLGTVFVLLLSFCIRGSTAYAAEDKMTEIYNALGSGKVISGCEPNKEYKFDFASPTYISKIFATDSTAGGKYNIRLSSGGTYGSMLTPGSWVTVGKDAVGLSLFSGSNGEVYTGIKLQDGSGNTVVYKAITPPTPTTPTTPDTPYVPNGTIDDIVNSLTGVFNSVKSSGVKIIIGAVGLGVIFIGGRWLWGKTKQWLAKV